MYSVNIFVPGTKKYAFNQNLPHVLSFISYSNNLVEGEEEETQMKKSSLKSYVFL